MTNGKEKVQLVDEDDDFSYGEDTSKTEKKEEIPEKKEEEIIEKKEEEEKQREEKKEEPDKSLEKKEEEPEKKEIDDSGKEKKEEEEVEKKEEKKKPEDEDIFSDEGEQELEQKISLKNIAKKFDVDLEKEDPEEFEKKVSERIAKSRQEFNLDGYTPDAKALIKHLNENEGDIDSFFTNKNIISLQSVLSLDAETKVRNVRLNELISEGQDKATAQETLNQEMESMSTREIKDSAASIDDQAKTLINTEVKKIVGEREVKMAEGREKKNVEALQQRSNLKTFIEKQDEFLGLKITPKAKQSILRDIDTGVFDKLLNESPEMQKFSSYMLSKHGDKILKKINSAKSEQNRAGYNAATEKHLSALHKVGDDIEDKKSGHDIQKKQATGDKPGWGDDDI